MTDRKMQRKLDLAVLIATAIDDPFREMMHTHTVVMSHAVDRMQWSDPKKQMTVSPLYVEEHSIPSLITTLMHEARHWKLNHHTKWQRTKNDLTTMFSMRRWVGKNMTVPPEFILNDNLYWELLFKVWNIAADCEIYPMLSHLPIIREEKSLRIGEWPCSLIMLGTAEFMFVQILMDEKARKEVLEFII